MNKIYAHAFRLLSAGAIVLRSARASLLALLLFAALANISCTGGGSGTAGDAGKAKVPLSINFSVLGQTGAAETIPSGAAGSVEIQIYRVDPPPEYDPSAEPVTHYLGTYEYDYSERRAKIEVFANETYSVYLAARIKKNSLDTTEAVYESESTIFIAPSGEQTVDTAAPANKISMSLKYSHEEKLYNSKLAFSGDIPQILLSNQKMPPFSVVSYDQNGNVFAGFNGTVEVKASGQANAVTGETTVRAVNGVASFNNVTLTVPEKVEDIWFVARAQRSYGYGRRIYITRPGAVPEVDFLEFVYDPPAMAARNAAWPDFAVKLLDKNGNILDTEEAVTVSIDGGTLSGQTSVRSSHGVAYFKGISTSFTGKTSATIKVGGISLRSQPITVVDGKVNTSLVFLFTPSLLLCYELRHSGEGEKFEAAMGLRWHLAIQNIIKIKPGPFKDKLYAVDAYNYFYEIKNLASMEMPDVTATALDDIILPRDPTGGGAVQYMGAITSFVPTADDLSVFLCTRNEIYKWHRVNKPWFVSSIAKARDPGSYLTDIVEYETNRVAASASRSISLFDFRQFPPIERTSAKDLPPTDAIDASRDGSTVVVSESTGGNIYRLRTADDSISRTALGPIGTAGGWSSVKFSEYRGEQRVFVQRYPEGSVYSLDLAAGTGNAIISGGAALTPAGLAISRDGRLLLVPNGSRNDAFMRIIDIPSGAPARDVRLLDYDGEPLENNMDIDLSIYGIIAM